MRRKDKEITNEDDIYGIVKDNYVCRLALCENNKPYVFSINYGFEDDVFYFHCANKGRKIGIIRNNNNGCVEISDNINIIQGEKSCNFSVTYRSVIAEGIVLIIEDYKEKEFGLRKIMKQYTGEKSWNWNENALNALTVLRLKITSLSGKRS